MPYGVYDLAHNRGLIYLGTSGDTAAFAADAIAAWWQKWNPIERCLFSQISRNWAGVPLRTWATLLAFIRRTTTAPGLTVQAIFEDRYYPIGRKVTDAELDALRIEPHSICPQWNYTIRPRTPVPTSTRLRELVS